MNEKGDNRITFAERNDVDSVTAGRFELGHVAFWDRTLTTQEIVNVYKRNILRTRSKQECCAKKRNGLEGSVYLRLKLEV